MSQQQQRRGATGIEDPILELRDTSVTFDMARGSSRVLDNVSLDIEREEVIGVVGESGSGKTMFASAIMDSVDDPGYLQGEVWYHPSEGDPVDILSLSREELKELRWEEIAFVVQGAQSGFNPTMKIEDHFVETLRTHDADIEEGMDRARQLLRDVYLEPSQVLESYAHQLSGGQKQRALIALGLVLQPDVLVMDEPTSALDLLMQRSIVSLLDELQEEYSLTIVFITHDLALVTDIADRIAVMYGFDVLEVGPSEKVLGESGHPYTRMLLNTVPNISKGAANMDIIEGSAPDPVDVPDGCTFHPRCPLADEQCIEIDPPLADISEDHAAACHYSEEARTAIPLEHLEEAQDDTAPPAGEAAAGERATGGSVSEPVVSMEDVTVRFEESSFFGLTGKDAVNAVDGVSLDIGEDDIVALVGESGCGKTTLGKTAIGLQKPTDGTVRYRDQDIWETKEKDRLFSMSSREEDEIPFVDIRKSLQIIHQDPGSSLNANYTVENELEMPLKRWREDLSRTERRERIRGLLEYVGMTPAADYAERYPHQLSGGEKQRVALIRALLMNPDMILADEAISALDVSLRVEVMDLMLDLQEHFHTSYLFISHDLANAWYLAKRAGGRIGIMYLGELVEIGPVEDVVNDPQHPYTKALLWATPDLVSSTVGDPPIRKIDVPDPSDPPEGCRFHTRCPEAREVCREQSPPGFDLDEGHKAHCYRAAEDHEYWDSPEIEDA